MPTSASLPLEAEASHLSHLCKVEVVIIWPHLAKGGLDELMCQAPEIQTFPKAIPPFLEPTRIRERDTHVHTNYPVLSVSTAR